MIINNLGFTLVNLTRIDYKDDCFIFVSQVKQFFYIEDPCDPKWSIVIIPSSSQYVDLINNDDYGDSDLYHGDKTNLLLNSYYVANLDDNGTSFYVRPCCNDIWLNIK